MDHGIKDSEKKSHAELSERLLPIDKWTDIGRKTLLVIIISVTVWAGCSLMHHLIVIGLEWLFHTADVYRSENVLFGAGVILAVMLAGGILRGVLLLRPEWKDSEGDGIDNVLIKYHKTYEGSGDDPAGRYSEPTFAHALRKIIMTTLTIGVGGSGGLEAPGVYLGETVSAGWSKFFKRPSADELRLYQLTGIAAAMGTLLAAPFTAAIFAAELVYSGRIIYRKLAYCLIAALIGYSLNNHLLGHGGLFDGLEHTRMFIWQEILLVFIVAVGFSAPAAVALGPVLKGAERFFKKIPIVIRAATGALITGGIAITVWLLFDLHPENILGMSEETINKVSQGTGEVVLQTWWILLLAVVAKTFATASTLKSGGSVGMLIPSMYMGGLVGAAAFYLLGEIGLYAGTSVTVFVATGMAAALTSVAGVPLASIALVIEVFGAEYSPAACFACAVCFTASRRFSLYVQPAIDNQN
jgi:CIC family chloride channel protein